MIRGLGLGAGDPLALELRRAFLGALAIGDVAQRDEASGLAFPIRCRRHAARRRPTRRRGARPRSRRCRRRPPENQTTYPRAPPPIGRRVLGGGIREPNDAIQPMMTTPSAICSTIARRRPCSACRLRRRSEPARRSIICSAKRSVSTSASAKVHRLFTSTCIVARSSRVVLLVVVQRPARLVARPSSKTCPRHFVRLRGFRARDTVWNSRRRDTNTQCTAA